MKIDGTYIGGRHHPIHRVVYIKPVGIRLPQLYWPSERPGARDELEDAEEASVEWVAGRRFLLVHSWLEKSLGTDFLLHVMSSGEIRQQNEQAQLMIALNKAFLL